MSLLMEALRKAEQGQQEERPKPAVEEAGPAPENEPDSLLVLDLPPELEEPVREEGPGMTPLGRDEGEETGEVNKVVLEPLPEEPVEPTTEAVPEPEPAIRQEPKTAPEPDQPSLEKAGIEPREERTTRAATPDISGALLRARARKRRRSRYLMLLVIACVLGALGVAGWYYLDQLQQGGPVVAVAPVLSEPPRPAGDEMVSEETPKAQESIPALDPPKESREAVRESPVPAEREPKQAEKRADVGSGSGEKEQATNQHPEQKTALAQKQRSGVPASRRQPDAPVAVNKVPSTAAEAYRQAMERMAGGESAQPIRIHRSKRSPRSNSALLTAWKAYQEGRFEEADAGYAAVLARQPYNRDALLGRAAVALMRGRSEEAQGYYLKLLERDPRDPLALAGMVSLEGRSEPAAAIARVQMMLAEHPDLPGLNFLLGNLYAAQSRWDKAQQAYFKAVSSDPGNADYLYNLAVSLDHLGKHKPAMDYYQQALRKADKRKVNFSLEAVRRRVETLKEVG